MKYVKPEFVVEKFMLNAAVAVCSSDFTGETSETFDPQPVVCLRGGTTEVLFNTDGCTHGAPAYYGYVPAGIYTESQLLAIIKQGASAPAAVKDHDDEHEEKTYTITAGYYVIFNGNKECFASATAGINKIMTNSY